VCQKSLELSLDPVGTAEGIEEPSPGERPVAVDGPEGEAEGVGRLPTSHLGKVPEFDHGRHLRLLGLQPAKGLIQGEDIIGPAVVAEGGDVVEVDPRAAPAVAGSALSAGVFDQDAAHGLGRGGEEVAAPVPILCLLSPDQSDVRLVDQCCSLQSLPGRLGRQPRGSQPPQLVIDEREQLGGGPGVAALDGGEDVGYVGHAVECTTGIVALNPKSVASIPGEEFGDGASGKGALGP